jgi:hypothetical protein
MPPQSTGELLPSPQSAVLDTPTSPPSPAATPTPTLSPTASPYCGADLVPPAEGGIPMRTTDWELAPLLERIHRAPLQMGTAELAGRRQFFLDATQTEFDAEFLCRYLESSGNVWSPEFLAFEHAWRRDEYHHYVAFRRLFARLYPDLGETALAREIEGAQPDFTPIAGFLADEFHVLTAIAFDEACTAKSYAEEVPFYSRLSDPVYAEWIRAVARDEVNHQRNAMAVVRARHAHRLSELPALLDSFLVHDRSESGYRNTFLFDHWAYGPAFLAHVADRLKLQLA